MRVKLERPRLVSLETDSSGWILTIGDSVTAPSRPLAIARNIVGKNRASVSIPFEHPGKIHSLTDLDIGDRLLVVTALGPARGFLKAQNFVELRALPSMHGVVLQPLADDVTAELAVDKITVTRPGGLSLSPMAADAQPTSTFHAVTFDTQLWTYNRRDQVQRPASRIDADRGHGAAEPTQAGAAQSRAFLSRFRHVGGGEGRAPRWSRPTRRATMT